MTETPEIDEEFPIIDPEKVDIEGFPELMPSDEDLPEGDVEDEDLDPPGDNAKVEGDEP